MDKLQELEQKIIKWGNNKGLTSKDRAHTQMSKLTEEMGEIAGALCRGNMEKLKDGIGDVFVVLTLLAAQHDMNLTECVDMVYEIISKRTGRDVNGVFVKDEDLH